MIKSASPVIIERDDLALAWGEILLHLLKPGVSEISPLTLSITGFDSSGIPAENPEIRESLDRFIAAHKIWPDVEGVSFTIFPEEYYVLSGGDRSEFFSLFADSFPSIRDWNPVHNSRGMYFQRLIDFEGTGSGRNQLEWIISEFKRRPGQRVSQFQATTFNPNLDQSTTAQLGFPCLQQISLAPLKGGGLSVNAFYATQQILKKGYGNYLGLCRLAAFMAREMGLTLERLNVFVGVAKIERKGLNQSDPHLKELSDTIRSALLT